MSILVHKSKSKIPHACHCWQPRQPKTCRCYFYFFEQKLNSSINNDRTLLFSHDFISVQIDIRKKIIWQTISKKFMFTLVAKTVKATQTVHWLDIFITAVAKLPIVSDYTKYEWIFDLKVVWSTFFYLYYMENWCLCWANMMVSFFRVWKIYFAHPLYVLGIKRFRLSEFWIHYRGLVLNCFSGIKYSFKPNFGMEWVKAGMG